MNLFTQIHPASLTQRPNRQISKPAWLQDYVCPIIAKNHCLNTCWVHAGTINLQDPITFSETIKTKEWKEAIEAELRALQDNETWSLTHLPQGAKPISTNGFSK